MTAKILFLRIVAATCVGALLLTLAALLLGVFPHADTASHQLARPIYYGGGDIPVTVPEAQ